MAAKKKTGKELVKRVTDSVLQVRLCDAVIEGFKGGLGEGQIIEAFMAGWQARSDTRLRITAGGGAAKR